MAWDSPPPIDHDVIRKKLRAQEAQLNTALDKVRVQLDCKHEFKTTSEQNLGGERCCDVWCTKCGFVWY